MITKAKLMEDALRNTFQPILLMVEDEPDTIYILSQLFGRNKVPPPIQVVPDGEAAIAYLAGSGMYADRERYPLPHLMLLDLVLPRTSGLEVLAWVRQQPGLKRLPVIILSVLHKAADINRAYELGCNSYLVKPLHLEVLEQQIAAVSRYWMLLNEYPSIT